MAPAGRFDAYAKTACCLYFFLLLHYNKRNTCLLYTSCLEELRRETVGLLYANEGMNRKHDFILVQISCVAALLSAVTINGQCADIFAHIAIIAALVVMVCISVKYLFKNDCKKRTFYKILKDQLDQILDERKKETRC